ncbi:MAG: peptidase M14 [Acidobacteria bacterium]|nr:MAG: peptidase M14 [Acidobacteriota bacterium]
MNDQQWLTRAERTNFQETSRYTEDIEFCKSLQKACPWIHFTTFGVSPQGRDLPLLIVSKEKNFEPASSNKALIFINNGIHSGEIAGKEATYMLLREIAITRKKESLLDNVDLLIVPIFNVDGHERVSPYNRMNQNGPKEMGWRTSSQNLNLNRDWMKAEQPEMQSMLNLFYTWLPDFVIDNHVSDGGDFQYDITWVTDDHFALAAPVREYFREHFEPRLITALQKKGHTVNQYFELIDALDPAKGITAGPFESRYCTGFCTLNNRPAITTETHSLKDFRTQVIAHYDLMDEALQIFNADPKLLKTAVHLADSQTIDISQPYPIRLKLDRQKSEPFAYHGIEFVHEQSAISGSTKIVYGKNPIELKIPYLRTVVTDVEIKPPLAYAIPAQWTMAVECLHAHQVAYSRSPKDVTGNVEVYRFRDVHWDSTPFEGHHRAYFKSELRSEVQTLPAGTVIVRLDQRSNKVIMGLLEPDGADSLVSWGYFNMIFEDKEYAENYILENLAVEMLSKNPALRTEFEERLKDQVFAADPSARLRFFYDRSVYADPMKNVYPIVRILDPALL